MKTLTNEDFLKKVQKIYGKDVTFEGNYYATNLDDEILENEANTFKKQITENVFLVFQLNYNEPELPYAMKIDYTGLGRYAFNKDIIINPDKFFNINNVTNINNEKNQAIINFAQETILKAIKGELK
jgi:hypothetical protein